MLKLIHLKQKIKENEYSLEHRFRQTRRRFESCRYSPVVMPKWWNGIHSGFRSQRQQWIESSSLSLGTKNKAGLKCYGSTAVSKTVRGGSTPSRPARLSVSDGIGSLHWFRTSGSSLSVWVRIPSYGPFS